MAAYKLVLHPLQPQAQLADAEAAQQALLELGLCGQAFDLDGRRHYETGPAFLELICFLGCAPAIELTPPAQQLAESARQGAFCHLAWRSLSAAPRLRLQAGQRPRCPACRAAIEPAAFANPPLRCVQCARELSSERLLWRQSGAYARIFLDIWGIHPAEAVPSDALLDCLASFTDSKWGFFYLQE